MTLFCEGLKVFRRASDETWWFLPVFPQSIAQTFAVGNFSKMLISLFLKKRIRICHFDSSVVFLRQLDIETNKFEVRTGRSS